MKKTLIAYAKRPLAGYAKTRLGSNIGYEESAGIYARFLYQCLLELVELDRENINIELSLASASDTPFFRRAFPEFLVTTQAGSDLGQRFTCSFKAAFNRGAESVVVVGTDIPNLSRAIIDTAFNLLEAKDVVIGPDTDGGYYLIGTRVKTAVLFQDIDWSSELVLQQTEQLLHAQRLLIEYLPTLSDVDTVADYQRWMAARTAR